MQLEFTDGKKLLDAGCGKGDFFPYAGTSDYYGIDISEDNVIYASRQHGNVFMVRDVLQTEFDDDYFDILVAIEVIEHLTLEDLSLFIREVRRITKNGSKIVFTTPNLYYLWGIIPWSFCPVRRRLTLLKLMKGIFYGYVNENYNLPVHHYRFKPNFLKKRISEFLKVNSIRSTYWYNNRAIHGLIPKLQMRILNYSNRFKTKFIFK